MSDICCFDTDVLSCFLVPKPGDADWEQKNKIATTLINNLRYRKTEIYLPSIVFMEILLAFPDSIEREKVYTLMLSSFKIATFDSHCAKKVAEVLFEDDQPRLDSSLPRKERTCIKEDSKILATALELKANTLYTNNKKDFQRLANGRITLVSLDEIPYHPMLLD